MERDATRVRQGRPFLFTALRHGEGVDAVIAALQEAGGWCRNRPERGAQGT